MSIRPVEFVPSNRQNALRNKRLCRLETRKEESDSTFLGVTPFW